MFGKTLKTTFAVVASTSAALFAGAASAANATYDSSTIDSAFLQQGAYGGAWGFADISATQNGDGTLTMGSPSVNDCDPYWFGANGTNGESCPGIDGNASTASIYGEEIGTHDAGDVITFAGEVIADDFAGVGTIIIKDFDSSFGNYQFTELEITSTGSFSIEHTVQNGGGVLQYGFVLNNHMVWPGEESADGTITVGPSAVPVPAAAWLMGSALLGLAGVKRSRK